MGLNWKHIEHYNTLKQQHLVFQSSGCFLIFHIFMFVRGVLNFSSDIFYTVLLNFFLRSWYLLLLYVESSNLFPVERLYFSISSSSKPSVWILIVYSLFFFPFSSWLVIILFLINGNCKEEDLDILSIAT